MQGRLEIAIQCTFADSEHRSQAITTVVASANYFQPAGTSPSAAIIEKQLGELDLLCELLKADELSELKTEVEQAGAGDSVKAKQAIVNAATKVAQDASAQGKFSEFA